MKRIYAPYAYGPGPRDGCWWDETIAAPDWPVLEGEDRADVGIIGGGFTGISAALHLAEAGVSVAVLEAETPGWGASGRNGGFCCLGGARTTDAKLARRFGREGADAFWQAEEDAVQLVADLIARHGIDADTHSKGETQLAHRPRDWDTLRRKADALAREGRFTPRLTPRADLAAEGFGGPFHGALTTPVGFGLNPRKYLFGLARAAAAAGARMYRQSPVQSVSDNHLLTTPRGRLRCDTLIVATNGYSTEDVIPWLAGRYIPAQSNVLVTHPLTRAELEAQGWTSDQMAYDTRGLLHYFRLMPDRRFLFGMRGGLTSSPRAEAATRARTRRDFEAMFPQWAHVEATHTWSGFVCLAANMTPFAGPIPGMTRAFAGLAYHGNGVAMGSYTGRVLAGLVTGRDKAPAAMAAPMARFPLGFARRVLMPPYYLMRAIRDL